MTPPTPDALAAELRARLESTLLRLRWAGARVKAGALTDGHLLGVMSEIADSFADIAPAIVSALDERDALRAALRDLLAVADLSPCAPIEPGAECEAELCGHSDCAAVGCIIDKINRARALVQL